MALFPLRFRPTESYHEHPRCFGTSREAGHRTHAGCDLYAPPGTEVLAVEDGTVLRTGYVFYLGSLAIDIQHPCGIVRYCEVSEICAALHPDSLVKAGQVIAKIGKLKGLPISMLHLELYSGKAHGPLSNFGNPPYDRRSDLINPTEFLDACTLHVPELPAITNA